jgi:hypothetical protein
MRIEHYRKIDAGRTIDVLTRPEHSIQFEAVGFELRLEPVYFVVWAGEAGPY